MRRSHPAIYWTLIGWWWEPTKWGGRMLLWLFAWPVGLWRTHVRHQDRVTRQQARYMAHHGR